MWIEKYSKFDTLPKKNQLRQINELIKIKLYLLSEHLLPSYLYLGIIMLLILEQRFPKCFEAVSDFVYHWEGGQSDTVTLLFNHNQKCDRN